MKIKRTSAILAASMIVSLLSGCGGTNTSSANTSSAGVQTSKAESTPAVSSAAQSTADPASSNADSTDSTASSSANESKANVPVASGDVFAFEFSIDSETYKFPFKYTDLTANGWAYSRGDENATLKKNQYAIGYEVKKGDLTISVQPLNKTDGEIPAKEANIGKVSLVMNELKSDSHEVKYGGAVLGKSTMDEVKAMFGEPDESRESETNPAITYKEDIYVEVKFRFDNAKGGVLSEIEIRNLVD